MDYAYELGDEAFFLGSYEPLRITRKPSDYLRMMYFDTVSYHAPAVECAIKTIGADRIRPCCWRSSKRASTSSRSLISTTPAGQDRRRHGEKTAQALG